MRRIKLAIVATCTAVTAATITPAYAAEERSSLETLSTSTLVSTEPRCCSSAAWAGVMVAAAIAAHVATIVNLIRRMNTMILRLDDLYI